MKKLHYQTKRYLKRSAGSDAIDVTIDAVTAGVRTRSVGKAARAAAGTAGKKLATAVTARGLKQGVKATLGKRVAASLGREVLRKTAKGAAKAVFRSNVLTSVAALVVDQAADTGRLAAGGITRREYRARTGENVGGAAGSLGGTVAGAALGTVIFPGVGTAIGGFLGGVLGALGGSAAGRAVGE